MDRTSTQSSSPPVKNNAAPFAYQTRLLERTASRSGGTSLARSNSQASSIAILTNPTGNSANNTSTRKWVPSHRVTQSLDTGKGRDDSNEYQVPQNATGRDGILSNHSSGSKESGNTSPTSSGSGQLPYTPPQSFPTTLIDPYRTATHLKRRTMPAPIIASPLSPNNTGVSVEAPSSLSSDAPSPRIRLPVSTPTTSHLISYNDSLRTEDDISSHSTTRPPPSQNRFKRSNTVDPTSRAPGNSTSTIDAPRWPPTKPPSTDANTRDVFSSTPATQNTRRRPTSLYGAPYKPLNPADTFHYIGKTTSSTSNDKPLSLTKDASSLPPPSVMTPPVYRGSNASKKINGYGELSSGRHLGRHLPRIASGDATDEIEQVFRRPYTPVAEDIRPSNMHSDSRTPSKPSSDDVIGVPGRLRLKAFSPPPTPATPLPSARMTYGLWADKQRHLLQAYEYLCHVGEAQQWIEGCLEEELGFGVVELEEGLRNGVILAKFVRVFQGPVAVPRIYEAPKLNFRHSDNINYFFQFVRDIGLPEGFLFELTDLYEKKNLPKVIYCIHALSHLLARKGLAERIGNLLGRLEFSEDQLQQAQKGLKDANVPMPNFVNVGKDLAKEINEEPEVELETEEERRERLLLENVDSIIKLQSLARGYLSRRRLNNLKARMHVGQRYITKLQAQCRGRFQRNIIKEQRKIQLNLVPWAVGVQAACRGVLLRWQWEQHLRRIRTTIPFIVKFQAQCRKVLQHKRFQRLRSALRAIPKRNIAKIQSLARAFQTRATHKELTKTFAQPVVQMAVKSLQAHARGKLARQRETARYIRIESHANNYVDLQAQCRGVLVRRRIRFQLAKLKDTSQIIVQIQAAVRTYLARRRLLLLIRALRLVTPHIIGFQARARAFIGQQNHLDFARALGDVRTGVAVRSLQALARAALARNQHRELVRRLDFVDPDVFRIQAAGRGALVRMAYRSWRDYLHQPAVQHEATVLQALLRGHLVRRRHQQRMEHYRSNLNKVVKLQSYFRAKETREQYRQLTMGTNVSVNTIKNFVHLLDDSENDFHDELRLERLRKEVVKLIRENQALESEVSDLDVKIALLVENAKSFEDLIKAKKRVGHQDASTHAARISLLAAHGDPFAGPSTLDQASRRKLELYQQLFCLLQTHPQYLSTLFLELSADGTPESSKRFTERTVLTLFGYGQDRREDFLLLKLFQLAISAEITPAEVPDDVINGHPMYISIAAHYVRPKQILYLKETFQRVIRDVVQAQDLNLEADPVEIYRSNSKLEAMKTGRELNLPKVIPYHEASNEPNTRAEYIRRMQMLQTWVSAFVDIIRGSTRRMPYGMRYLVRETLGALRTRFPDGPEEIYMTGLSRLVYYRYIYPALMAPETFDIINKSVDITARKNLAHIATVLTQVFSGLDFAEDAPNLIPINNFVQGSIHRMRDWLYEVADVPDAETYFHAHEFLDVTVQPKSIYISPNEIYTMHSLLQQHLAALAGEPQDPLRSILMELDGVPHLGDEELKEARDTPITLELTNRFTNIQDAHAEEKTLWVKAKRAALAVLRVHPNQDLLTSLLTKPTEEEETRWEEIVDAEIENEQVRQHPGRQASAIGADSAYRLEDIRTLNFASVKFQALESLLALEQLGKVSRDDNFQGILNAIASDVRSKHRKRLQRQQEMASMREALKQLKERKQYFEEQIAHYHHYVDSAMTTMQRGKGKKRLVMPFSKQFFHVRNLQKAGEEPAFGSYKYSAKRLYDRKILISIDQYSPRQFDKMELTFSSDATGIYTIELTSTVPPSSGGSSISGGSTGSHGLGPVRLAREDIRMEDLLQAKYENRQTLSILDGKAQVNIEAFLAQINKKFCL